MQPNHLTLIEHRVSSDVTIGVRNNHNGHPYTHCVMTCRRVS
jgi:hypothetical protein